MERYAGINSFRVNWFIKCLEQLEPQEVRPINLLQLDTHFLKFFCMRFEGFRDYHEEECDEARWQAAYLLENKTGETTFKDLAVLIADALVVEDYLDKKESHFLWYELIPLIVPKSLRDRVQVQPA